MTPKEKALAEFDRCNTGSRPSAANASLPDPLEAFLLAYLQALPTDADTVKAVATAIGTALSTDDQARAALQTLAPANLASQTKVTNIMTRENRLEAALRYTEMTLPQLVLGDAASVALRDKIMAAIADAFSPKTP